MNWMPDQQGWLSSSVTTKLIEPGRFSSGSSGDREGIEDAVVGKRRFQYEDEVRKNPLNYDYWFDYIRLEESVGNKDRIREVYDRSIANVPPPQEKRYWQRYIFICGLTMRSWTLEIWSRHGMFIVSVLSSFLISSHLQKSGS